MHLFLRPIILLIIVYGDVNKHISIELNPLGHKNACKHLVNRKKSLIVPLHKQHN